MRFRLIGQALLVVLLVSFSLQLVAGSIPPLRYLDIIPSEKPFSIAVGDSALAVIPQRSSALGIYIIDSGVYYEITLRDVVKDAAVLGGKVYVVFQDSTQLAVVDIRGRETTYVDLGYRASEITGYGDRIYVIQAAANRVVELDAETLEETRELRLGLADVAEAVKTGGGYLWAMGEELQSLTAVELSSGAAKTVQLDDVIKAFGVDQNGAAWVLLAKGDVLMITGNGEKRKIATLENIRAPSPSVAATSERAFLFDNIQKKIIEVIRDGGVEERKTKGASVFSLTAQGGRVWFVDRTGGRVGWFSLSKPPAITDVNMEKADENRIRVSASIEDPEGDVETVTLVVTEYVEGRLAKNDTAEMRRTDGQVYEAVYKLGRKTDRIDVRVVARDQGGNLASKELGRINVKKLLEEGVEVTEVITTTTGDTDVFSPVVSQLAVQLLLAIPLLGALFLLLARRKTQSRRRTRR